MYKRQDTDYARYALGNIYYRGDDVEQDYEKAFQILSLIHISLDREEPEGDKIVP